MQIGGYRLYIERGSGSGSRASAFGRFLPVVSDRLGSTAASHEELVTANSCRSGAAPIRSINLDGEQPEFTYLPSFALLELHPLSSIGTSQL